MVMGMQCINARNAGENYRGEMKPAEDDGSLLLAILKIITIK